MKFSRREWFKKLIPAAAAVAALPYAADKLNAAPKVFALPPFKMTAAERLNMALHKLEPFILAMSRYHWKYWALQPLQLFNIDGQRVFPPYGSKGGLSSSYCFMVIGSHDGRKSCSYNCTISFEEISVATTAQLELIVYRKLVDAVKRIEHNEYWATSPDAFPRALGDHTTLNDDGGAFHHAL